MNPADRLALGTVQLGMDYGVANRGGRPGKAEARAILDAAWRAGVSRFDTAPGYGDSESLLGDWSAAAGVRPRFLTKLPALPASAASAPAIAAYFAACADRSLRALRAERLWGLLLHEPEDWRRRPDEVSEALAHLRADGVAEHVGASLYLPEQAEALGADPRLDLFQVPLNPFDLRFAGALPGRQVLARSCFLQGLFFLDPAEAAAKVPGADLPVARLRAAAAARGISVRRLALGFALAQADVAAVVIGVDSAAQLAGNLEAAAEGPLDAALAAELREAFAHLPPSLIDPSRWPRAEARAP